MQHRFVEYIPDTIADGVVYVSIRFATAVHKCACGCGAEVVTPLTPTDWQLTFDGETISLYPSIGNWALKCRSHYWIAEGEVEWASRWSDEKIALGRERDRANKARYFAGLRAGIDRTADSMSRTKESLSTSEREENAVGGNAEVNEPKRGGGHKPRP